MITKNQWHIFCSEVKSAVDTGYKPALWCKDTVTSVDLDIDSIQTTARAYTFSTISYKELNVSWMYDNVTMMLTLEQLIEEKFLSATADH